MIRRNRDPSRMSAEERLQEIAQILARGFLRLSLSGRKGKKALAETPREDHQQQPAITARRIADTISSSSRARSTLTMSVYFAQ